MKISEKHGQHGYRTITGICGAVLLLCITLPYSFGASLKTSLSPQETLRLGERMYREGILPSGEPMQAYVKGDIPVAGTAFTCVSCHQRSGFGSKEGGVFTPPTTGKYLFQAQQTTNSGKYSQAPPRRPVYTDETLAAVLRGGVDPSGRVLDFVMPRYHLRDQEMAILVTYLKSLSAQFSPGVSDTMLKFATVFTDDVSSADRDAMLDSLDKIVAYKNNQAKYYRSRSGIRSARMAESMVVSTESVYKQLSLSRWRLTGPPETWHDQLEEYYRKEPVFALLGGITNGPWQPIHKFSEDNHIPCILPVTDQPVVSEKDWYTLYFSKGLYQEGEATARYLNGKGDVLQGKKIVQIVRASRQGGALSAGFQETWRELGHPEPVTVTLQAGETMTPKSLQLILAKDSPAVVILWVGSEDLPALEAISAANNKPVMVFVSSSYLGKNTWVLPEQVRDISYLTYPYRLPQEEGRFTSTVESFMGAGKAQGDSGTIVKQIYSVGQVLYQALMEMNGNYYRDNLLDVIGMSMGGGMSPIVQDQNFPLYERLSFGPGQRYASKGCFIVQLAKGPKPELVKKSDWVIH